MQKKRWGIVIAVLVLVVFAIIYGFLPKPVPVDTVKAARGQLRVTIDEEGKTRVRDRFVVSATVGGYMKRIELKVGDPVKKGQAVAQLEPLRSQALDPRSRAAAEAAVSSATGALNAADENARAAAAGADYARQKLDRDRKLYASGYIAKDQLDQSDSDARRAEANLLSAEASVKVARSELNRTRSLLGHSAAEGTIDRVRVVAVQTPVSGSVLKLHRESEGVVNAGDPLIDVGDPAQLEIMVEVLSSDAVNIKPGTPVVLERWGGGQPLEGKVRTVEPAAFTKVSSLGVEEQRVLVIADITSVPADWQRLGDSYRVEASFIIWEDKNVLQVPSSALFREGDGWSAFAIKSGRARKVSVRTGHRNGLSAEVLSGLTEDDTVITHPDETIRDGVRVRIR